MEKINDVLKDLGFHEKEIKIYLVLIKNPEITVLNISKSTNIDRTNIYDILKKLINKGIVSQHIKNKSKHFSALTPKELVNYFNNKYQTLEYILPELNKITNEKTETTKCELFHGVKGLKSVLISLINEAKEYRVIGIKKEYEEILGYFNNQGIIKLNEFNAKELAIVEKNTKFKKLKNGEYRYLNSKFLSNSTTLIYDNKVIFFIWDKPYYAIKIENRTFTKAQTENFEILWNFAKE